ncbi:MAG: permease [Cyanobacteria bacterium QS_8_64_29]|nr:MAG: permease [Cyanobacteria bacterium QS_8_64_29]
MAAPAAAPRWFVRQDIDGFFGLALDNLVQILAIVALTQGVLDFPPQILYGRVLPSLAMGLIVGNGYYSWLAYRQGRREGRDDITALPYGINTVSLFAFIFLVMLPVKSQAMADGATATEAARLAWQAGMVACLGSGLIELIGAFAVDRLRRFIPRAALLGTLGGVALTFIAMKFVLRTYAYPLVGLVPLAVVLLTYFGSVRFRLPLTNAVLPGGLVALVLGTALAWATGLASWDAQAFAQAREPLGAYLPQLWMGELWQQRGVLVDFFSVIVPMGLFNLIGSLQNLESAEAAGDRYPGPPCLAVNGIGSIAVALFGSCFPTTIYIGHPGWKALGARVGYSWLNGAVMGLFCLTGAFGLLAFFIPIESGMAIVLWIGLAIVAQSFTAIPARHVPAVAIALLPGIAGWGASVAKSALQAAGMGTPKRPLSANSDELLAAFQNADTYIGGAFALEQGLIFSAMLLAAMTAAIIDREFLKAALWSLVAAALAWVGLIHGYRWTVGSTAIQLDWGAAAEWALGYMLVAVLLLYAQWQKRGSTAARPAAAQAAEGNTRD